MPTSRTRKSQRAGPKESPLITSSRRRNKNGRFRKVRSDKGKPRKKKDVVCDMYKTELCDHYSSKQACTYAMSHGITVCLLGIQKEESKQT